MVKSYNPKDVSLIFGGQIIEGFADGTFITVARNNDSATYQSGSQGGGTRVLSGDKSGRVTFILQQSSKSNGVISAQLAAMELSGAGITSMLGKDSGSGDRWAGATTWVVKPADMDFANELSNRTWILETDELEMVVAGQAV